ncbi:hypothetical protein [Chitinophaga rhizosphaerae]|uniref:hypothetical protein n=1 Tax=Chitinophaga rhizosphaerae TaxID=1864947 RepID=UPI000F803CB7|nr:hypothetical protein [Chitinophaga rhizosphaerae]
MLSQFSWFEFSLFVGGCSLVWILYVLRHHILGRRPMPPKVEADESPPARRIWSVREEQPASGEHLAATPDPNHLPYMPLDNEAEEDIFPDFEDNTEEDDGQYLALENMAMEMSELTAGLGIAITEDTLLTTLRQALQKYPTLSNPHHRQAIDKLIIRCARQDCGITLSPAQVANLWPTSGQDQA